MNSGVCKTGGWSWPKVAVAGIAKPRSQRRRRNLPRRARPSSAHSRLDRSLQQRHLPNRVAISLRSAMLCRGSMARPSRSQANFQNAVGQGRPDRDHRGPWALSTQARAKPHQVMSACTGQHLSGQDRMPEESLWCNACPPPPCPAPSCRRSPGARPLTRSHATVESP